jgi:hypothetical protein
MGALHGAADVDERAAAGVPGPLRVANAMPGDIVSKLFAGHFPARHPLDIGTSSIRNGAAS